MVVVGGGGGVLVCTVVPGREPFSNGSPQAGAPKGSTVVVVSSGTVVDDSGTYQTTIFQVTFFELGLPCVPTSNCETAWGEGEQIRPNKNWAMTFNYDPYCQ